ncbi:MAG TPA: VWA domain-containing protein [Polyangiaceae bacterium]|nr:VWA domain-containing protein [Polyangiaceae bacterium]
MLCFSLTAFGALFARMPRSTKLAVGFGVLSLLGWNCVACSSSSESRPGPVLSAGGAGANPGSGGEGNGLNVGTGNNTGNSGGTGVGMGGACAGKVSTAQAIPLDVYIMLDTSGSMLDSTATQATKWDAVKLALESFLTDKDSAGLGVGLQYFPLQKTDLPASCSSDAQCGDSAPCFLKYCSTYRGLVPCQANADCLADTGEYYGPCVAVGRCSKDQDYFCAGPGEGDCTDGPNGEDLGACELATKSICLNTTSCDVAQYTTPARPIATLPGAAASLVASIDAQMPGGDTPTAPALGGAIAQARAWAKAHPDHRVVVVLATDGLPTNCTPTATNAVNAVAALARAGVTGDPSINTFVIGVFGPDDVRNGAPGNLNQIAQQGGTNQAFIVDTQRDVTMQFQDALDAIRGARLACQYQVPEPMSGGTLEYEREVNVTLTNGKEKTFVYYVTDEAGCDPRTGGWYYDIKPSVGTPTKIIACPTTCSAFQAAPNGASVSIELGCLTVIK